MSKMFDLSWNAGDLPAWCSCTKPDPNAIVRSFVPFLMHVKCSEQRDFSVFDQTRMHGPFWVSCVFSAVHHDFAQAATDTAFFDCLAESVEAVPISELNKINCRY